MSRSLFLIVSFSFLNVKVPAQVFNDIYLKYTDYHAILDTHQTGYYQDNIFLTLGVGENIHPLAFDAYGSLYPDFEVLKYVSKEGMSSGGPSKYMEYQYSMFQVFKNVHNYQALKKGIKEIENNDKREFYFQLLDNYSEASKARKKYSSDPVSKGFPKAIHEFYYEWDQFHKVPEELMEKIEDTDKVIFFFTGFSNPYNFITLQSLELYSLVDSISKEKTLLIPVLWTAQGNKEIKSVNGKFTDNVIKKAEAVKIFFHHFNQAYLTAGSMRRVLNQIENESNGKAEISLISHSSGTTLATSIFIDTAKKMKHTSKSHPFMNREVRKIFDDTTTSFDTKFKLIQNKYGDKYAHVYPVNYEIFNRYSSNPIPIGQYKIFMSAASMPGQTTFQDLCASRAPGLCFFNTINKKDADLRKKTLFVRRLSSTELGKNFRGDALNSATIVIGKGGYFKNSEDVNQSDHSLFNYMTSKNYKDLLAEFLLKDVRIK